MADWPFLLGERILKVKNLLSIRPEKLEEMPGREIRKHVPRHRHWYSKSNRWGTKYPSNKVIRFLHANIGKPWNDVFSKYCHLDWIPVDLRNLEHIKWHVVIDTFLKDNKVVYIPSFRSAEEPVDQVIIGGETERFYVDPRSKKLCVVNLGEKKAKDRKDQSSQTMRIIGDYHQLLKMKGMWYEVKAELIKPNLEELIQIKGLYYKEANVKPVERWVNGVLLKDIAPADGVKYTIHNGKFYLPAKSPIFRQGWLHPLGSRERIIPESDGKLGWMRYTDKKVDPYSFKITLQRQLNSKDLNRHGLKNDPIQHTQRCDKCGGLVGKDCLIHYCAVCKKPRESCKCYP